MPFPEYDRVIYANNPLFEVVAQLSFPAVLRIDVDEPADFQDLIRGDYPVVQEQATADIRSDAPELVRMLFGNEGKGSPRRRWTFSSDDEKWRLNLERDFIALATTQYERWEAFSGRLKTLFDALCKTYKIPYLPRVGLRYKNSIDPIGLKFPESFRWSDVLKSHILGELGIDDLKDIVTAARRTTDFKLDNDIKVRFQNGLGANSETERTVYIIDSDFYIDSKIELNDAFKKLDSCNAQSGRIFRWCITDALHDAMDPAAV